jgi:hypothetical protein
MGYSTPISLQNRLVSTFPAWPGYFESFFTVFNNGQSRDMMNIPIGFNLISLLLKNKMNLRELY